MNILNSKTVDDDNLVSASVDPDVEPQSDGAPAAQQIEPTKLEAWSQVFFSHLINFNSFGYLLSFGIFQTYYSETLNFAPSHISWIGTIQLFLLFFIGVFSGRLLDAGYYRYTLTLGIACQLIAVFTTSLCDKYYQLFLSQGLLQGLGNGLLFCPAVALVSTYFPPHQRALALSLVACGGATGGMVFPAIAQNLLEKVGFGWTVRIMGFVMLGAHGVALYASRPWLKEERKQPWIDKTAFKDVPYLLFCTGIFLGFWGLFFAYYYVRAFGRDVLHTSQATSFDLILIINSLGVPGRIVPNYLADRYFGGALNIEILFFFISGILLLTWIAVRSLSGFYIWVAVYGFFAGGCQSLFQAAASGFSPDSDKIGVRIGIVCTVASFACLSGPPIAGSLIEAMDGSYLGSQIFGGIVMVTGAGFLLASRVTQAKT